MSEHAQIVREYILLRNHLAKSNPRPNMEFEIHFKVEGTSLMAFNTVSKAKVELARIRALRISLYLPDHGNFWDAYAIDLVRFVNKNLNFIGFDDVKDRIIDLAQKHKKTLNLGASYKPTS